MANNEKNASIGLSQEKVDILRNVISEARNAGLDDLTIETLIFSRSGGIMPSMEVRQTFTEIAERCGMGTIMEEDYMNPNKSYTGYSIEMRDAVDDLFQEGKSESARGERLSAYWNLRTHSKTQPEASNTVQQDEISTEPEIETPQQPLSQEKVDILRNVIREARNAGLDDLTIESLIFSRSGGIMPSMEDRQTFTEIAERCGMGTMMSEDYLNPNKSYTGYSIEMRDAVDDLFQEGKSESARGERLSAYWNLRMHSKTQPEVSDTMQPEEMPAEMEVETIQQSISQENTEKLRLAISEARNAGIDDMAIQSFIFSRDTGKFGHMDMETFSKWAQISNKYGISTIMGEDYLNPNKSYRGYSTEMRDAVNGLFQEGKSEEEQGYRISDYGRTHSKKQPEVSDTMQPEEISTEPEMETTQQPISQWQIDKLRKAIYEARRNGMDAETINRYIYPFQTVKGEYNIKEARMWGEISSKYGIPEMMHYEYFLDRKLGFRQELRDAIDSIAQEEMIEGIEIDEETTKSSKSFSLTQTGKSAYQHFGKKVAEKLKEAVNAIKSKFLSKDKTQTNDLDTSR